jgi:tungstate transport system ATP-binding protein
MKPILSVRNLEYRRGDRFSLAVDRLDFLGGEVYYLVGANGAGKSTLLSLLALLQTPNRGEILFDGIAVQDASQRQKLRRQVTLVEQAPFLFDATVYQNLAFGLRLREVRGELQRHRIEKALQAVGLTEFGLRRARALSGGETQRVALARALVLQPRVLLLDEPTDGLDQESRPLFENCLADLPAKGVTVIIATHDAEQPRRLPGKVLRIEAGRLAGLPTSGPTTPNIAMENV